MFKYTRHTLKKIEEIFKDLSFKILYEKGNFQSGYCIVDETDIIVINKFFDVEARINCLIEIMDRIEIDISLLSEANLKTYQKVIKEQSKSKEEEVVD